MTLLTASVNSFQELVRQRLLVSDEFTGLLTDASLLTRFDHIIFLILPQRATLFAFFSFPEPGAASSKVTQMVLPVLGRWRAGKAA